MPAEILPSSALCLGPFVWLLVSLGHKVTAQIFLRTLKTGGVWCSLVAPCNHTVWSFCPLLSSISLKLQV